MSARQLALLFLMIVRAAWAGQYEVVDPEDMKQQKILWHQINAQKLILAKQLKEAREGLPPLAGVEKERALLEKKIEMSKPLIKFLFERRYRDWKSATGARLYARYWFQGDTSIRLKSIKGQVVEILLADLSKEDLAYLKRVENALAVTVESLSAQTTSSTNELNPMSFP